MWSRSQSADERTARRLMHLAGEGARRDEPGAEELLRALQSALFRDGGDDASCFSQRGRRRRGALQEHEAARTLARAR